MFECFRCEKVKYTYAYSMSPHWGVGKSSATLCIHATDFYEKSCTTASWQDFITGGKARGVNVQWWRDKFGKGDCSVYAYVSKENMRDFRYVGKNETGHVRTRMQANPPRDDEIPYLIADGLSVQGARLLEKHLLQHHDLNNPLRRLRNIRYTWEPTPEKWTQAELMERSLEVLAHVVERIEGGEVGPFQYTTGKRSREVTPEDRPEEVLPQQSPSTERIAATFATRTPQQLNYLIKRAQQEAKRTGSAKPTKRGPRDGGGADETTIPKARRTG